MVVQQPLEYLAEVLAMSAFVDKTLGLTWKYN